MTGPCSPVLDLRGRPILPGARSRRRRPMPAPIAARRRGARSSPRCARAATPRCATSPSASTAAGSTTCASRPQSCRRRSTPRARGCAPRSTSRPRASATTTRSSSRSPRSPSTVTASRCASCPVPVGRAGLYVPGGRAAYPSTVLMTAIPAQVAGVAEVVLRVPPTRTAGSRRRRWPRPRWPGSTRCTASAARRRSPRWRTAPRRSGRST